MIDAKMFKGVRIDKVRVRNDMADARRQAKECNGAPPELAAAQRSRGRPCSP